MSQLTCHEIMGRGFRPLFERTLTEQEFATLLPQAGPQPARDVQRRPERGYVSLDWRDPNDVAYTAGWQNDALIFVSIRFASQQLSARRLISCLGPPGWYHAWCEDWPQSGTRSLQAALTFYELRMIAYCGDLVVSGALEQAPHATADLPVRHLAIFGASWAEDPRALGGSLPWPGDWADLVIPVTRHSMAPLPAEGELEGDLKDPAPIHDVLAQIAAAFADVPRPSDDDLLHPAAYDDSDIQALIGVPRWQDLPDASIEGEYSALAFLSPAGFRHFLPAYLSWILRHPDSGAAVVSSTIFDLAPVADDPQRSFMLSKFSLLDDAQRAAVVAFLKTMAPHEDVAAALLYWRD